ncbi:T9SS-dependent choice-of-anchor J family protein [Porphyromonas gingivalis]|uniref:T9SS-dependent choice-of-anchor J family protein n=3 Tax=Porphyromonas gingivalis TaxID=837 RepID=UPI001E2CBD57|nr:choice-of-anchor J domain-containing protein [Porphyromonas gingivalis]
MMKSIVFRAFLTILLSWAAITNPTAQEISGMNASCLAAPAQPDTILYESFENGPVPNGWLEIDADADGATWGSPSGSFSVPYGHNGLCTYSHIRSGISTAGNYLITPNIEGAKRVKYWVCNQYSTNPEHYAVMVSTTGTAIEDFVLLFDDSITGKPTPLVWRRRIVDLPEGTKYIAWRHYKVTDSHTEFLKLDDVTVYRSIEGPEPATDFTVINIGQNVGRLTWNYPEDYQPEGKGNEELQLSGYNIYANGTLLAQIKDVSILEYVDSTYSLRDNPLQVEYCVTAVYDESIESSTVCGTLHYATDAILYENFENGPVPNGWLVIDADGDGFSWGHYLNAYDAFPGHNGGHCSLSASYVPGIGPVTPDNYLITPKVKGAKRVKYWVSTQDANWAAEHYAVMASTTGTAVGDFVILFEETMTAKPTGAWYERTINLPEGTKYIAWRHYNCTDIYFLKLDDITVFGTPASEPEPVTDFVVSLIENNKGRLKWNYPNGYEPDKTDDKDPLQLAGYNIYANGSLLVHIQDPTVLEYIDETYSSRDGQVEVEYCVTAVYNDNIESQSVCDKLIYDSQSDIILYEGFEAGSIPEGWLLIDADGDNVNWDYYPWTMYGHDSEKCIASPSYLPMIGVLTPDNYLVTPRLEGAKLVKYWVSARDAVYSAEHYAVMVSTTGTAVEDFVLLFEETMTAKANGAWYERTIALPAGTKYIAWRHYDCTDMFFLLLDDITVYRSTETVPEPVTDFVVSLIENNKGRLKWNYPNGYEPDKTDDKKPLQLTGYNIYANGSLLVHIQDPTVLEYIDETYSSRDGQVEVEYCVTAVYNDNIESQSVCDKLNYSITSLDNIQSDTSLKIYPNPASHVLRIEGLSRSKSTIELYNALGICVLREKTHSEKTEIDVSRLNDGVYLIKVTGGNKTTTEKVEIKRP